MMEPNSDNSAQSASPASFGAPLVVATVFLVIFAIFGIICRLRSGRYWNLERQPDDRVLSLGAPRPRCLERLPVTRRLINELSPYFRLSNFVHEEKEAKLAFIMEKQPSIRKPTALLKGLQDRLRCGSQHSNDPVLPLDQGPTTLCAICLDQLSHNGDLRPLHCGHSFHSRCIDPWIGYRHACCPYCKANVPATRLKKPSAAYVREREIQQMSYQRI